MLPFFSIFFPTFGTSSSRANFWLAPLSVHHHHCNFRQSRMTPILRRCPEETGANTNTCTCTAVLFPSVIIAIGSPRIHRNMRRNKTGVTQRRNGTWVMLFERKRRTDRGMPWKLTHPNDANYKFLSHTVPQIPWGPALTHSEISKDFSIFWCWHRMQIPRRNVSFPVATIRGRGRETGSSEAQEVAFFHHDFFHSLSSWWLETLDSAHQCPVGIHHVGEILHKSEREIQEMR